MDFIWWGKRINSLSSSASEINYIVSGWALNSTHSLNSLPIVWVSWRRLSYAELIQVVSDKYYPRSTLNTDTPLLIWHYATLRTGVGYSVTSL